MDPSQLGGSRTPGGDGTCALACPDDQALPSAHPLVMQETSNPQYCLGLQLSARSWDCPGAVFQPCLQQGDWTAASPRLGSLC